MRNKKNNSGFTLIELLVVIAIIGLLASVVLLALNSARQKSRDAKRLADVRQIASAMELYFNDFNSYPTSSNYGALVPNYIGLWPSYPTPIDSPCLAGNSTYAYSSAAAGTDTTYQLVFCISQATCGYSAGQHTLSQVGIQ